MKKLIVVVFALALTACAVNKEQGGAVIGGVAGGILGNQIGGGQGKTVATVAGVLIGALVGGSIGRSMDQSDQRKTYHALETVPTGKATTWRNPDTEHTYMVQPTKTYERDGNPCREYTTTAFIGGKKEQVYGTACRQNDGTWKAQ